MYTNSERFKTKGAHNVSTNAEGLKRFHRLHGNQVLLGGSIWRTQEGIDRNWGRFKINLFSFGKFCLFQVRITNILPGFVWTEGVYFIQYMCVCVFVVYVFVCMCVFVTFKYDNFVFLQMSNTRFKRPPMDVDRRKESSRFHKVWIWRPWRGYLTKVNHIRVLGVFCQL